MVSFTDSRFEFAALTFGIITGLRSGGKASASAVALGASACMAFLGVAFAQAPVVDDLRQQLDARQLELRGAQDTLKASDAQRRAMEAEVEVVRNDRARLNAALIETTARTRATEGQIGATEKRLDASLGSEAAIRRSLESRRAVVGEVLAALQRMGRKPPPAVLVSPQDMLGAVRTSMLLGAVVPELRAETRALAADLMDLVEVRKSVGAEREQLVRELAAMSGERQQLAALVDARQQTLAETEQGLQAERGRAQDLARQTTDLKDLIQRMETEVVSAARAAEAARKADEAQRKAALEKPAEQKAGEPRIRLALGPFRDPARLAPAMPFVETKGLLPMPAAGTVVKRFGAPDGFGGAEKGLSFTVRPGSAVSSPTDGWIVYSGPYRSYGQLLIINAGGGYYVVLAGMEKINVEVRQFVLAGEPVATMSEGGTKTASALALGATQPILYVEFRKDGASIDPGPWWAKPEQEKVRG